MAVLAHIEFSLVLLRYQFIGMMLLQYVEYYGSLMYIAVVENRVVNERGLPRAD